MKFSFDSIVDLCLLKKNFYSKLTDKSMWVYIGIVFVGIRDVCFIILSMLGNTDSNFNSKFNFDLKTAAILFVIALIIGLVDVISFSYPIFDVIKHFKKKSIAGISSTLEMAYSSYLTKVMKVYIVGNIIITPIDFLSYYTNTLTLRYQSVTFMYITAVLSILAYFWFNGAITRGLCVLFKLPNSVRGLVFVLVFFWNALLGEAIGYLLNQVLVRLL